MGITAEFCCGLFVAGVGCTLLFVGGSLFRRSIRLYRTGTRIVGHVAGHETIPDSEGETSVEVVFTDLTGVERQSRLRADRGGIPPVGQPFSLIYDPSNPQLVLGMSYDQLWFAPVICCILGSISILMGVAVMCGMTTNH